MKYYSLNIYGTRVVYQVSIIEHPKNVFNMESIDFYDIREINEMIETLQLEFKEISHTDDVIKKIILEKLQEEKQNRRYKKIRKLI